MALTQWQLKPVATDTIASGDFVAFSDEGESGDPINKLTIDNLMETGLPLVTEDTIAVASDYILFLDGGATGNTNKEQFADVMTAIAGTGLSASSGVINVDAAQTGITSVGALNAGSITSGFGTINNGSSTITTTGAVATGALTATGDTIVGNGYGLLVGHASQVTAAGASTAEVQVLGTSGSDSMIKVGRFGADAYGPSVTFLKSRDPAIADGSFAIVADDDLIGRFRYAVDDGNDFNTEIARIEVEVDDGSPAENAVGGAIVLRTATTSGTMTEALRLDSAQNATFAGSISIPATDKLYFDGTGDTYIHESSANVMQFFTAGTHALQINASQGIWFPNGYVIIAPTEKLYFDNGNDTYIYEESADDLHVVVGGAIMVAIDQDSTNIGIGNATDVVADTMVSVNGAFSHGSPGAFQVEAALTTTSAGTAAKHFLVGGSGSSITTNFAGTGVAARISTAEFFEPNITLGTSDTATIASTLYIANAPTEGVTNAAIYVAGGDVIIGSGSTAAANSYSKLVIAEDDYARIELINPADRAGSIWFSDATEGMGRLEYSHSSDAMQFRTSAALRMTLDSVGTAYIGTDSANANMTIGLTINQASLDDEIMAFKSSDISHGMTDTVETDTFGSFRKQEPGASGGGLRISGYSDTNTYKALVLEAFSADATPDTTDTSNSAGVMEFNAGVISGTDITNVPDGANAFVFGTSDLTDAATVMVIKGNGDVHQTTDAHTALDDMADAELIRAYEVERAPDQVIKDKWDDIVRYNEADLIAAGVLGKEGRKGLTNTSQLMRLHSGAIWQGHAAHLSLAEKVDELEVELIEAKKQLAAISA